MPLQFNLLGSLSIETDGAPSELLKSPKGCALVTYLIVTAQAHTREFLADLRWEATSTAQALHNLRALLPLPGCLASAHLRKAGLQGRV